MSDYTNPGSFPDDSSTKRKRFNMPLWWMRRNLAEKIVLGIGIAIAGVAGYALFTWLFMLLWNAVVPAVFGAGVVNFWQALGILIISSIVFGGASRGKSSRRRKAAA